MPKTIIFRTAPRAILEKNALTGREKVPLQLMNFILTIIQGCEANPESQLHRKDLITLLKQLKLSASDGTIWKRTNELLSLGVIEESTQIIEGQQVNILLLKQLGTLVAHYEKKRAKPRRPRRPLKNQLELNIEQLAEEGTFLAMSEPGTARIESLFSILDASMKLSGRDKRKRISCQYNFGKTDFIKINTVTTTSLNGEVAHLSDQRAMRAINGKLLDDLETAHGSLDGLTLESLNLKEGYISFDLYDLCRRMGLRPNDQNRDIVRGMIYRLKDTTFEIDATNSEYFKEHHSLGADKIEYRYITEFYAKKETVETEGQRKQIESERYYVIKIHSIILANLITTGRTFISHPELVEEKSGLPHRLNNWSKAHIGVREKSIKQEFRYVLDELRDKVLPSARLDNFERDFLQLIKRQCQNNLDSNGQPLHIEASTSWEEEGTNVAWIYGYYYKVEWDEHLESELNRIRKRRRTLKKSYPVITIWRDTLDEYVGDNSRHAQALQRSAAQLTKQLAFGS